MLNNITVPLLLAFIALGQQTTIAGERIYPEMERPVGTTALCIGRNSNGYTWENGDWARTGYKPSKYTIKKVSVETKQNTVRPLNTCPSKLADDDDFQVDDFYMLSRCYVVSELGQEALWREVCIESYDGGKLTSVNCTETSNISFRPNGRFIAYSSSYDLRESSETNQKDSIYVEHGECSDI
jgi:hypothetical protein